MFDPSYWGNPPQTPTKHRSTPAAPAPNQAARQPAPQPMPQQPAAGQNPYDTAPQTGASQQPAATQTPCASAQNLNAYAQDPNAAAPQTPNAAPAYQQTAPPPPPSNGTSKRGIGLAIGIVAVLVLFLGISGCVACSSIGQTVTSTLDQIDLPDRNDAGPISETTLLDKDFRTFYDLDGDGALAAHELRNLGAQRFGTPDHSDTETLPAGVYFVGDDLSAGTYWFEGSDADLSYFFILQPSSKEGTYDVVLANNYYGHNLMELAEGEVLVIDNNARFMPIENMTQTFSAPYSSGVYRVGVDVPAGTYQLGIGAGADDFSACYVMSDLSYADESYLYEERFVKSDDADEVDLEEGTYVELYNMTMAPVD